MAATDIVLHDEVGLRVPSVKDVPIVAGDQVSFTAADGAASALYFPAPTASILSPDPGSRVDVLSGQSVTYTFASENPGSYGVIVQAPDAPPPDNFDFGHDLDPTVLHVCPGDGVCFGGGVIFNQPGGGG
jgi:hypothetical protein